MKTMQFVSLSLLTGIILLSACQKDDMDVVPPASQENADLKTSIPGSPVNSYINFREDFANPKSLALRWHLFGTPQPQWVSFAFNRFGLFDNNGRLPNGSYAISKARIGNGYGYTIESDVYINVTNPRGAVICPEIGVTRQPFIPVEPNHIESGISMKLMYVGTDVVGIPAIFQNHTYVVMKALVQDGPISSTNNDEGIFLVSGDFAFQTDYAGNGWHQMKIVVDDQRNISFSLDGQFIWSPKKPVHASMLKDKNLLLGFTSPGSCGKAYLDYVKITYPRPEQVSDTANPAATE